MSPTFNVTETGSARVARLIEDIGTHAVHARPAMAEIMAALIAGEAILWKRRSGTAWQRADGDGKAGVKTGTLERSFTEPAGEGAIREIHDDHLVFGSSVWYGHFLLGTKHQKPRKPLSYGTKARRTTEAVIAKHLLGDLK